MKPEAEDTKKQKHNTDETEEPKVCRGNRSELHRMQNYSYFIPEQQIVKLLRLHRELDPSEKYPPPESFCSERRNVNEDPSLGNPSSERSRDPNCTETLSFSA
uniref:Zisupton n=1 Tax=Nothobranchius kadleci TaxID=1051664 RepID=A0A1A8C903_NOTKA